MKFIRSNNKPYQEFYILLKALYSSSISLGKFREYEDIEWDWVAAPHTMIKINDLIKTMAKTEFEIIVKKETHIMSDARCFELTLVFWMLSKIQSDFELLEIFFYKR